MFLGISQVLFVTCARSDIRFVNVKKQTSLIRKKMNPLVHDKCRAFEARIKHLEKIISEVGEWVDKLNIWDDEYDVQQEDVEDLKVIIQK
jgi:hypothetical protein